VSLGHPCKFQRVSRLGSITARHCSSGHQPNFAALNRGRHLYSAGWPSRWALAHILVVLDFVSSVLHQKIGWKVRLQNDLFCVEWEPTTLTQSVVTLQCKMAIKPTYVCMYVCVCVLIQRYVKSESDQQHVLLFDLITKLLHYKPTHRLTLSDALRHPFFD